MVKGRRTGGRNSARGVFAFFWIVLGGVSGLYLFTLFTDPAALGSQTVQLSAITGQTGSTSEGSGAPAQAALAPAAPAPAEKSPISASELSTLKQSLQTLSQQTAQLDARLKPIERFVGPVAALPPSASVTTSPPAPEAAPETEADVAAPAPAAVAEAQAEEPAAEEPVEEVVEETEVTEVEVPAEPEPAPTAPQAAEPPAVAETDAVEAPASGEPAEIAAFDPVTLPPAANDGSTRYGIEIGSVKSRDDLRPLWRELLTKHAALVAGLQPRRVKAPDNSWRLIAGPFAKAEDAEGACTLFKKAERPCAATVYAGDAL